MKYQPTHHFDQFHSVEQVFEIPSFSDYKSRFFSLYKTIIKAIEIKIYKKLFSLNESSIGCVAVNPTSCVRWRHPPATWAKTASVWTWWQINSTNTSLSYILLSLWLNKLSILANDVCLLISRQTSKSGKVIPTR